MWKRSRGRLLFESNLDDRSFNYDLVLYRSNERNPKCLKPQTDKTTTYLSAIDRPVMVWRRWITKRTYPRGLRRHLRSPMSHCLLGSCVVFPIAVKPIAGCIQAVLCTVAVQRGTRVEAIAVTIHQRGKVVSILRRRIGLVLEGFRHYVRCWKIWSRKFKKNVGCIFLSASILVQQSSKRIQGSSRWLKLAN